MKAGRRLGIARPPMSGFRGMWLLTMFDLPVKTKSERRTYTRFRKRLIACGFQMLQYSVYAQFCTSEDASSAKRAQIRRSLPRRGQVRLVSVTDHQFGRMEVFLGENRTPVEPEPTQLVLF